MIRLSLITIFIFASINCFAQQYNFSSYSIEDGLAQSQAAAIYADSRGYIWVGTQGGLSMFDGINFKNFSLDDGNRIESIYEDNNQNMWFGRRNGNVVKYDGVNFTYFNAISATKPVTVTEIIQDFSGNILVGTLEDGLYRLKDNVFRQVKICDDLPNELSICALFKTKEGILWIGTKNNGAFVYKNPSYKNYTTENGLVDNFVQSICEDNKGNIWFGTQNGLSKYNGSVFVNYTSNDGLCGNDIRAIEKDKSDNLWLGSYGNGLTNFDGQNFRVFNERNGLCSNNILSIVCDSGNNIWLGTDGGGICKFEGERFRHLTEKDGLVGDIVMTICEGNDSSVWMGSYGKGISVYSDNKFTNYTKNDGLCSDLIYDIIQDRQGAYWLSSKGGGVTKHDPNWKNNNCKKFQTFDSKNGLSSNLVYQSIQDRYNNIWFATFGGGICIYNGKSFTKIGKKEGFSSDKIYTLFEDRAGNIWVGTEEDGVAMIFADCTSEDLIKNKSIGENQFFNLTKYGLPNKEVLSITQDSHDNIWIGTYGGGVARYDGSNLKIFSEQYGLYSNNIYLLLADSSGFLWIGTEKGLCRLDIRNNDDNPEIRLYSYEEGFIGIETDINASIEDSKGHLWFGNLRGATMYDPEFDKPNTTEPITNISAVKLFFLATDWKNYSKDLTSWGGLPKNLVLPYNENHLTFEFTGIDHKSPKKVMYQWILEGFDKDWSPPSSNRSVTYQNIPYGEYTFVVKGFNNDGVCNENPATFHFIILQPWWSKWWFYALILLLVAIAIIITIRLRIRVLKREKNILAQKVELRTCQLQKEKAMVEKQAAELKGKTEELEKLSVVASETANAVTIYSCDGIIEFRNKAFTKLYGETFGEKVLGVGENVFSIINAQTSAYFKNCQKYKQPIVYYTEKFPKNQEKIWIQTTLTPILDTESKVVKLISIDTDITEIMIANEKIHEQSVQIDAYNKELEKLSIVASKTDNAIIITNEKGEFIWVNEGFTRIFEYTLDQIKEKSANIIGPETTAPISQKIRHCMETKESVNYIYEASTKSGKKIWIQVTLTPIIDKSGNVVNLVAVDTDITELKRIEAEVVQQNIEIHAQRDKLKKTLTELSRMQNQLVESEKMASLGNLIAGVAHEINTPVGIGITASSLIVETTQKIAKLYEEGTLSPEEFEENFQTLFDSGNLLLSNLHRAADLVHSFKQVSVDQITEQMRTFLLYDYITKVISSLKPELLNPKIDILINCDEKIQLNSFPGIYAQILTNLIINSKIHGFSQKPEGLISINIKTIDNYLIFEYNDNGKGASKNVIEKMFEPFFTTNKQKGTGLGMHIIYNLVTQKLKGTIICTSIEGRGIKFIIRLPLNI